MSWKYNTPPKAASAPQPAAAPAAVQQPSAGAVPPPTAPSASAAPAAPAAPAALPAFQPSPDPVPPTNTVAAPAAPKRGRPAKTVAAPAAPPMPTFEANGATNAHVVSTQPAAPAAAVVIAPAGGGALARMLTPTGPVRMAVSAVTDVAAQSGGELNLFPTLTLQGGISGGMLKLDAMNEEHSDDDLQEGTRPTYGVLMGYRINVLCWPRAYDEKAAKQSPRWRAVINADGAADGELLTLAYKAYQFRSNRPEKGQPDQVWDPIGHLNASIELLLFEPKAGLICMRSATTFDSFTCTSKEIQGVWPDGIMSPKPVIVSPASEPRSSKTRQWTEHFLKVAHHMGPETKAAWEGFAEFCQQAGGDLGLNQALTDWQTNTLNDDHRGTLDVMSQTR